MLGQQGLLVYISVHERHLISLCIIYLLLTGELLVSTYRWLCCISWILVVFQRNTFRALGCWTYSPISPMRISNSTRRIITTGLSGIINNLLSLESICSKEVMSKLFGKIHWISVPFLKEVCQWWTLTSISWNAKATISSMVISWSPVW